jgi:hypothetical protein
MLTSLWRGAGAKCQAQVVYPERHAIEFPDQKFFKADYPHLDGNGHIDPAASTLEA